ncbi:hypothetical protein IWW36_002818 [Coemansia brasiliensis]|uniref:Uncharacterized protein n=1 Tax=Coemansia brasiliensis TaxID=2650707 RepID=A0A9W8M0A4_9FUNG|nr:hypothetical protein IWW36_002818 [Coemansia brasiliensis]
MASEQRKDRGSTEAVDVESAKRNLQALVAAGIQAQDLLDGSDEIDSTDGSSDDSDVEDNEQKQEFGFEKGVLENSSSNTHSNNVIASYMFEGSVAANSDAPGRSENTADSHQELLSRVASNFQALIGHGLTTAAGGAAHAEADDGDDDEAYQLACKTLENNLRYQRQLRAQLAAIDAAQARNAELQESIGMLLSLQGRATTRRGGRRGRDERSAIDPVTGEAKIGASTFFVDVDGERPPRNRDTIRKEKHPPIVYRARRWTEAEREALARGVRQNNRKILSQRLFQQTKDPRSIWEVEKMADSELEMNLAGLDWKYISKNFVPQHKSVECAIQWATQDHPIINRAPWTRREEKALSDVVQQHGGRDWVAIAKALGTQRTAAQCFQVYQRKLNPDMSRSKWTPEEDRVLTEAVMTYGEGDWQSVAACLDNRTGQQVLHRWCKSINPAIRSGRWDRDEDIALLAAVRLYGVGQWTKIAKHVPGRTDVKCRERYMNVLTPDVNNSQWTHDEDERLIAIVSRVGIGKWSYVADLLGGRTDNQCWRHWRSLHKRGRAPDPPEDPEDECDEGTVPTFPEWDGHSPAPDSVPSSARKRKSLSGIDSARKRQWKRATSTNFVPLLAAPPDAMLDTPARPPRSVRARSAGSMRTTDIAHLTETPTRRGRPARASAAMGDASPLAGSSRRASAHRRGRALNWSNVLHVGAEGKTAPDQAHIRPVLPCLGTAQSLLRLVHAVPEVATAFNAELVGIDSDGSAPPLDSLPMNWLRQRIEMLFIWPLMLGTLDTQQQQHK